MARRFPQDPTDIFAALNAGRVKYLVVGGVAAILHGFIRTTNDVDVAVELEIGNLQRLERTMAKAGFAPRIPDPVTGLADPKTRDLWTRRRNMQVFSYTETKKPFRVVDVMVRPMADFERRYAQRMQAVRRGVRIPVLPIDALIRMKRLAGRPQDLEDVAYLEAIRRRSRQQ